MRVEGFPIEHWYPRIVFHHFASRSRSKVWKAAAPFGMALKACHPFRMRIGQGGISADLNPVVQVHSGRPNTLSGSARGLDGILLQKIKHHAVEITVLESQQWFRGKLRGSQQHGA